MSRQLVGYAQHQRTVDVRQRVGGQAGNGSRREDVDSPEVS